VNQDRFESIHGGDWDAFELWLTTRSKRRRRDAPPVETVPDKEIPRRYRALCQHLALARDRQYSTTLVERLNTLVMRGHQFLYGAHPEAGPRVLQFFAADFPRAVRRAWRPVLASSLLFFGPLLIMVAALQFHPDFIHTLMSPHQVRDFREMYDPSNPKPGIRTAQADTMMFGHYIWNNVRIGFQTFAGGLLFGVGAVVILLFNGVIIGAVMGYLLQIGFGTPFLQFVAGHSGLELSAIALMGGAGLMLGAGLVMPGGLTRTQSLQAAAREAVPIVYGAASMLVAAAFVEAFWSPITVVPPPVKYTVGIVMWVLIAAYLLLAGRRAA
jgi:uncharacterized membrane protein SpoIIM required for sporulation